VPVIVDTDDAGRVRSEVERPAVGSRQRADERMDRPLEGVRLVRGELEAEPLPGVGNRVVHAQPLQPRFHLGIERVVRRAHVGELGVGAGRRHGHDAGRSSIEIITRPSAELAGNLNFGFKGDTWNARNALAEVETPWPDRCCSD